MELIEAIASVRDSVVGVLRIRRTKPERLKHGKVRPAEVQVGFAGTAFCVVTNKYLVTAHHIFEGGKPRNPDDKFYVFSTPQNGPQAYPFPVIGVAHEDPVLDVAVLEIGPSGIPGQQIPAIPFTSKALPDGSKVFTYGFPAPVVGRAMIGPDLSWQGGDFLMKAHANEGIVAAQYELGGHSQFEFNVGWYNGESGGPVFSTEDGCVVAIMQAYRNIQSPHGIVAGPHLGRPLASLSEKLLALGAVDAAARPILVASAQAKTA